MSYGAWLAYCLSGVFVGILAKKHHIITAIICGIVSWLLIALIEIPDWSYYFGYTKHPFPFQPEMLRYYGGVAVAVVALMGLGGLIGKGLQAFLNRRDRG
jgi:hypothetical protein